MVFIMVGLTIVIMVIIMCVLSVAEIKNKNLLQNALNYYRVCLSFVVVFRFVFFVYRLGFNFFDFPLFSFIIVIFFSHVCFCIGFHLFGAQENERARANERAPYIYIYHTKSHATQQFILIFVIEHREDALVIPPYLFT